MSAAAHGMTSDDRELLRDAVRGVLERHWPAGEAVAAAQDPGAVRRIWKVLCEQGLGALGADAGLGEWREILIVMEELGRAGCPAPMLEAALLNGALAGASLPRETTDFVGAMQAGTALPSLALGSWDGDPCAGRAELSGGLLGGTVRLVEGARPATHFVVALEREPGLAFAAASAAGVTVSAQPGLAAPAWSTVQFEATPAACVALPGQALRDLGLRARLGCAARAHGAARRAFELVVDYAKIRVQFGQPIGRFQAIQHKLADCLIALEGTGLLLAEAAEQADRGKDHWRVLTSAAFAQASVALRQVALETHHAFGAVGYSEEHEAPRHFRRVHADLTRLGGVRKSRAELADHLLRPGAQGMPDLDLGEAANAFRVEVRDWLAEHWNADARRRHRSKPFQERDVDRAFTRELGRKGWVAVSWPKEYGGQGRSPLEQYVFVEEMNYAGAPTGAHTCSSELIGPALIAHGTPEQKAHFLPAFLRGDAMFSLGYSESGAGSDLASLRFSAIRDGDEWVLNGEKIWTTRGEVADYHWLAARTDPAARPPHAGISVFMVPLDAPGITVRPSMALYGHTFASVHYDNVRMPDSARVGAVNGGWKVITHALAAERVLMGASVAAIRGLFDELVAWIAASDAQARPLRDDPIVRDRIGALAAEIEAARQLAVNGVRITEQGRVPVYEAAMSKVYSGELMQRVTETAIDLLGAEATLGEDSAGAPLGGRIEQMLRRSIMMVVGGGTAQIQRTLVAQRGLGLPR